MAKETSPTSVGERSYNGERAFQQLLNDIRTNKAGASINIESIDSKNAHRLLSAIAGQQRTYGARSTLTTLNLQEGRIGGDFFRMLREMHSGSRSLEINLPGHTISGQDGLYLKDIQKRNPGMKVNFGDNAQGFDSSVVTTYKPNDFTRSTSFEFSSPKTQFAKVAPEPRVVPFGGAPRSYAQPANVTFVDPARKKVELGRVYDSSANDPAVSSSVSSLRDNARNISALRDRTNWTNGTSVGRNFDGLNEQFNRQARGEIQLAAVSPRTVPHAGRHESLGKKFNTEAWVENMVNKLNQSIKLEGDPAKHEWSKTTLSHIKGHVTQTISALPYVESKLIDRVRSDANTAQLVLSNMLADGGKKPLADYMKISMDENRLSESDRKNPYLRTSFAIKDKAVMTLVEAAHKDLQSAAPEKVKEILEGRMNEIHDRTQAWETAIARNVSTQYTDNLANKLIGTPQKEWSSIIPANLSEDRLLAVKERLQQLAATNRDQTIAVADRMMEKGKNRYEGAPSSKTEDYDDDEKKPSRMERQKVDRYAGRRAEYAFNQEAARFTSDVKRDFVKTLTNSGDRDSIVDQQRNLVLDIIPKRMSDVYKTEESMVNAVENAKEHVNRNFDRFNNDLESFFGERMENAPKSLASNAESDQKLSSTLNVTPILAV